MAPSHIAFVGKIKLYFRKILPSQESAGQVYCKALGHFIKQYSSISQMEPEEPNKATDM